MTISRAEFEAQRADYEAELDELHRAVGRHERRGYRQIDVTVRRMCGHDETVSVNFHRPDAVDALLSKWRDCVPCQQERVMPGIGAFMEKFNARTGGAR